MSETYTPVKGTGATFQQLLKSDKVTLGKFVGKTPDFVPLTPDYRRDKDEHYGLVLGKFDKEKAETTNYLHIDFNRRDVLTSATRYGRNDVTQILEHCGTMISEHSRDFPDLTGF